MWKQWSEWDSCNVTCGGGEKARRRECDGPYFNGDPCEGPNVERLTCNTFNCPSKMYSVLILRVNLNNVASSSHLKNCFRTKRVALCWILQVYSLKMAFCSVVSLCFACLSVDGIWEVWGSWTECSRPCGTGEQIRSRNCVGPFYEGRDCQGDWNETKSCNTHSCAGRMSIVVMTFEESQWVRHTQCVFGFAVKWLSHFLTVFLIETYWTISENQSTDF